MGETLFMDRLEARRGMLGRYFVLCTSNLVWSSVDLTVSCLQGFEGVQRESLSSC
jgi:hypothetical protein